MITKNPIQSKWLHLADQSKFLRLNGYPHLFMLNQHRLKTYTQYLCSVVSPKALATFYSMNNDDILYSNWLNFKDSFPIKIDHSLAKNNHLTSLDRRVGSYIKARLVFQRIMLKPQPTIHWIDINSLASELHTNNRDIMQAIAHLKKYTNQF